MPLAEISLHRYLSSKSGINVAFVERQPGKNSTPDYEIQFPGGRIPIELKSILSDSVRLRSDTHFLGTAVDKTAREIWKRYQQAIFKNQIDARQGGIVVVDVSHCDELFIKFGLANSNSELREHAGSLLHQLAMSESGNRESNVLLMVLGIDPSTYNVGFFYVVSSDVAESI